MVIELSLVIRLITLVLGIIVCIVGILIARRSTGMFKCAVVFVVISLILTVVRKALIVASGNMTTPMINWFNLWGDLAIVLMYFVAAILMLKVIVSVNTSKIK